MLWMRCLEAGEFPWKDPHYREYMDPLLACGQALARELGYTKMDFGTPLLMKKIVNRTDFCLYDSNTLEILDRCHKKDPRIGTDLALRAIQEFDTQGSYFSTGSPESRAAGLALLALLGAGFITEGMPNLFTGLPRLFSLIDPAPSAWREMAGEVFRLIDAAKPLVWEWAPEPPYGKYYGAYFGLTPRGLTFFGLPPVDATPASAREGSAAVVFPERRERPRRRTDSPPAKDPAAKPGDQKEDRSEPGEGQPEVLSLEKSTLTLGDLILPEEGRMELAFIARLFKEGTERPVMLFHGPPGTGKTHAARCLAGEAGAPLGTTSLDRLLNKYIGDTEKGLTRAFKEAGQHGAVLLLDEADALLYDRGTMYLTWQLSQVNTLLKLLENPPVPVILCTNFLRLLDSAVHRRIHHMVEFPIPGFEERRSLWTLALGKSTEDIDVEALAAVPLTGGLIRNVMTQAARRKKVIGASFSLNTRTLLALARKERPKMAREVMPKSIGFEGPRKIGGSPLELEPEIGRAGKTD